MSTVSAVDAPSRRRVVAVLVAAGLGGFCFAPVFGVAALAGPVLAVCLSAFLIVEGTRRSSALTTWRPVLLAVAGLLVIVETMLFATTLAGLPTAATGRALASGLWSWRRTLESTWPARPDAELALFVPLLVLVACLLAIEVLDRFGALPAMLPSLAVIGLSQAYVPASGAAAYLLAIGYAATAAAALAPTFSRSALERGRRLLPVLGAMGLAVAGLIGGLLAGGFDPAGNPPYTLRRAQAAQLPAPRVTSPLDDVARRLAEPDAVAFRYRADTGAKLDRWRLVALDDFDGSNWTTDDPFLRFGTRLAPSQAVRVPMSDSSGEVDVSALPGPWLPSQPVPLAVGAAGDVLVEPRSGTLLATGQRPRQYTLSWSTPQVTGDALLAAAVDRDVPVGDVGNAPEQIVSLAGTVVDNKRATFQTALALERFLANRCELASGGARLPSGHGWPQLRRFLFDDRRGTSEQFAAAYVALARLNGIPARLVVGFRAPAVADLDGWTTVRNRDVLVWPEVAVDGIGWWPLDPAGLADPGRANVRAAGDERDEATSLARKALPPVRQLDDPAVPSSDTDVESGPWTGGLELPAGQLAWLLLVPPAGWVMVVPFGRWLRRRRRRRRPGSAAVTGAWSEARDLLRAHGVPVTAGMTVRDLAAVAAPITGEQTRSGLERLALAVDAALWSPGPAGEQVIAQAWAGVGEVTQALRARPWRVRLRAALDARGLLRPQP